MGKFRGRCVVRSFVVPMKLLTRGDVSVSLYRPGFVAMVTMQDPSIPFSEVCIPLGRFLTASMAAFPPDRSRYPARNSQGIAWQCIQKEVELYVQSRA
jgi:hypothetical protein